MLIKESSPFDYAKHSCMYLILEISILEARIEKSVLHNHMLKNAMVQALQRS